MTITDELESRLRFVEADMASEKEISHATLQQAVRNSAVVNALRTEVSGLTLRVDQLVADAAVANSTLRHHSTLLMVLQDVTAFRQDVTALRRGHEELHVRLDRVEGRLDQFQTGVATRFDGLESRFDHLELRFDGLETRFDGLESRFDHLASSVAAILAAVAPQTPPAA